MHKDTGADQRWELSDTGQGMFFVTSPRGRQLEERRNVVTSNNSNKRTNERTIELQANRKCNTTLVFIRSLLRWARVWSKGSGSAGASSVCPTVSHGIQHHTWH